MEDWREPFERALDDDWSNQDVRGDLADHLEERGDPDGEAVRWLAERDRVAAPEEPGGWLWFWHGDADRPQTPSGIPHAVWMRLRFRDVAPSRREAEADFCRAYHLARADGWNPDS
jgi:hypothetical protein